MNLRSLPIGPATRRRNPDVPELGGGRCHCGYCRGKRTMKLDKGVGWRCRATNCLMLAIPAKP